MQLSSPRPTRILTKVWSSSFCVLHIELSKLYNVRRRPFDTRGFVYSRSNSMRAEFQNYSRLDARSLTTGYRSTIPVFSTIRVGTPHPWLCIFQIPRPRIFSWMTMCVSSRIHQFQNGVPQVVRLTCQSVDQIRSNCWIGATSMTIPSDT